MKEKTSILTHQKSWLHNESISMSLPIVYKQMIRVSLRGRRLLDNSYHHRWWIISTKVSLYYHTILMTDTLQWFRQPLVTATGIMLWFILNFAANWVKSDTNLNDLWAYSVALFIIIGIVLLILTLYRILSYSYPREQSERYYSTTLLLFTIGVWSAFVGVVIDMRSNFMS